MDNLNLANHLILESPGDILKLNSPLHHHPTREAKKTPRFQGWHRYFQSPLFPPEQYGITDIRISQDGLWQINQTLENRFRCSWPRNCYQSSSTTWVLGWVWHCLWPTSSASFTTPFLKASTLPGGSYRDEETTNSIDLRQRWKICRETESGRGVHDEAGSLRNPGCWMDQKGLSSLSALRQPWLDIFLHLSHLQTPGLGDSWTGAALSNSFYFPPRFYHSSREWMRHFVADLNHPKPTNLVCLSSKVTWWVPLHHIRHPITWLNMIH